MTTQEKIGLLEIQKEQIESQIEVAKAELFLVELFETATFTSSVMIAGGFHEGAQRVFSSFSWLFSEGAFEEKVRLGAKHFKAMDDSAAWPSWKSQAIKAAKILDAKAKRA